MNDSEEEKIKRINKDFERKLDKYSHYEFDVHVRLNQYQKNLIERFARNEKGEEGDAVRKMIVYAGENYTKEVHRDNELHLVLIGADEPCFKCGANIVAPAFVRRNKVIGALCEKCDPSFADKRILKKMEINRELDRKLEVLQTKVNDEALTLEAIDNEKTICKLLNGEGFMVDIANKLASFLRQFGEYADADAKAYLKEFPNEVLECRNRLLEVDKIRKVLVEKYNDAIFLAKRRKQMQQASVQKANGENVHVGESESLRTENR